MPVSVSKRSYTKALEYYYSDSAEFKRDVGRQLKLGTKFKHINGKPVSTAIDLTSVQTCALRTSYALWACGEKFGGIQCIRFVGTYNDEVVLLPSVAAQYKTVLAGETTIKKKGEKKRTTYFKELLKKTQGIILFSGGMDGATGHVTFCRSGDCADGSVKYYEYEDTTIYFWPMAK